MNSAQIQYVVSVETKRGYCLIPPRYFTNREKARSYYLGCLVRYLNANVIYDTVE